MNLSGDARGERSGRRSPAARRGGIGIGRVAVGLAMLFVVGGGGIAWAQGESNVPDTLPTTTISPAGSGVSAAPIPPSGSVAPEMSSRPPRPRRKPSSTHVAAPGEAASSTVIEPASGHLRLIGDSWAYSRPDRGSARLEPVQSGKYVNVTGTTRYYLQVRLKSGKTAYVPYEAVDLVTPTDKIFHLTTNSPVLAAPNHAAKRLAEVHQGHDVHVVGVALTYMKIRMRDGLEGFIPDTALE